MGSQLIERFAKCIYKRCERSEHMDVTKINIVEQIADKAYSVSYDVKDDPLVVALDDKQIYEFVYNCEQLLDTDCKPRTSLTLELDATTKTKIESIIDGIVDRLPANIKAMTIEKNMTVKDSFTHLFKIFAGSDSTSGSLYFDLNNGFAPSLNVCMNTLRKCTTGNFTIQFKGAYVDNEIVYVQAFLRKATNLMLRNIVYVPIDTY